MGAFQELKVWQKAKSLAISIYEITSQNSFLAKDYRLKDQMRSAAISIASNIAEGDESGTTPQSIRFFYIAKGSNAELTTQLIIMKELKYLESEQANLLIEECNAISKMLFRLIQARKNLK